MPNEGFVSNKDRALKTVLFLCTGNYYRSRFAEELFNSLAARQKLPWRAASRGLAVDSLAASFNIGPLSAHVIPALRKLNAWSGIAPRHPIQCAQADLAGADLIISVKEAEHRRMLTDRYPGWESKCRYWHVHDLDAATADQALAEITDLVADLIRELAGERLGK